jgi:hypothetical protein
MPIFARRVLQNLIDTVAPFSMHEKIQDQIRRLNAGGQDAISTAWELAVTAELSRMGVLKIEPDLETPTRVDFSLSLPDANWSGIGDIVTVFDHGMHEESGYGLLETVVWQSVQAHGLRRRCFNIWIDADVDGAHRRRRIRLPRLRKTQLREDLKNFLLSIKKTPAVIREIDLRRVHGILLRYDPKQYSGTWSGTKINAVYGIDANPLMNALKRKAEQLRKTVYGGSRFIVCCDGGSEALRARRDPIWRTPSTEDILKEFLRQNTSISGVVAVIVNASPLRAVIKARDRVIYATPNVLGPLVSANDEKALDRICEHLEANLPRVIRSPSSFPQPWKFKPDYGFFRFRDFNTMSSNHIQIPMRQLLELLSGTITQDEFFERNVLNASGDPREPNLFKRWLNSGRVIAEMRIIADPDQDDDWVEFKCGPPNPALTAFRNPGAEGGGTKR